MPEAPILLGILFTGLGQSWGFHPYRLCMDMDISSVQKIKCGVLMS